MAAGNLVARLCVIPMAQEARGLDAGPRLEQKLRCLGDPCSAALVARIAAEEVAHVAVGELPRIYISLPITEWHSYKPALLRLPLDSGSYGYA